MIRARFVKVLIAAGAVAVIPALAFAQGSDQACYWVYRERGGQAARWYLHGLFA